MIREQGPGRGLAWLMGAALVALLASSACLKVEAKTPGPGPALTTPEPPPRVLIPVPSESLLPPPVPTPTPEPTPSGATPRITPRPTATPTPTTTPTPTETPAPILQTTANMALLESQARELIDRAQKDLDRVKRATLSPDARDNYDSAARYIRLAHAAMLEKNFLNAKACADKAAIIAGLLVK